MKQKFTLIELLVVIAIIGILTSILIPSLENSRYYTKSAVCKSNQRQLGIAFMTYADENNAYMLPGNAGPNSFQCRHMKGAYYRLFVDNYLEARDEVFECPVAISIFKIDNRDTNSTIDLPYAYFGGAEVLNQAKNTEFPVTFLDDFKGPYLTDLVFYNTNNNWTNISHMPFRKSQAILPTSISTTKGKNGLYLDGHVEWHDIGTLQQTPAGTNSIFEWMPKDMW